MYTKVIVLIFSVCVYVRVICDEVNKKGHDYETQKIYFPTDFLLQNNQHNLQPDNYQHRQPDNYQHRQPANYEHQQPENYQQRQPDNYQHRQPDNYEHQPSENYQQRQPDNYQHRQPDNYKHQQPENYQQRQPDQYQPREEEKSIFRQATSENHNIDQYSSDERSKSNSDEDKYSKNSTSIKIPLYFIQNLNEYNVSDLLLNFLDGDVELEDDPFIKTLTKTLPLITSSLIANIKSRFGDDGARSAAIIPKAAGCTPEKTTVRLATSNDPSVLYIPQCTKVDRCSGCCSHTLLSCQPVEKEIMTYQVIKTQYTGGKKLKALKKEVVLVERHTKCKCDCKVKAEDCNKYQEYRPSECRCACTNLDEEKKCYKNNSSKLWDPNLCACQCRDIFSCSTGYTFDHNECRCNPSPESQRLSLKRRGFATKEDSIELIEDDF